MPSPTVFLPPGTGGRPFRPSYLRSPANPPFQTTISGWWTTPVSNPLPKALSCRHPHIRGNFCVCPPICALLSCTCPIPSHRPPYWYVYLNLYFIPIYMRTPISTQPLTLLPHTSNTSSFPFIICNYLNTPTKDFTHLHTHISASYLLYNNLLYVSGQ